MNTQSIIENCIAEGFNPLAIYCQVTGQPIGEMHRDALEATIQQILPADDDDIVSELWTRTMASARPSPMWTMLRADSLNKMLAHAPKSLLAYLLNRLYDPIDHKLSLDTRLGTIAKHIKVWQKIESINFRDDDLDQLLLVLLSLDTRFGLKNYAQPAIIASFDFALNHQSDHRALIRQLNDWLNALDKKREADEKRGLAQARAANSLTRTSFATQFLKASPPSKTREKAIAKQAEKDYLSNLLDTIMGESESEPDRSVTIAETAENVVALRGKRLAPVPGIFVAGAPRPRFGVKKESI